VYLVNEILFDDLGVKYLHVLLDKVFQKIIDHPTALQIGPRVPPEESHKNILFIMKVVEDFIQNLNNSAHVCPV
jgi:hypothetical protein